MANLRVCAVLHSRAPIPIEIIKQWAHNLGGIRTTLEGVQSGPGPWSCWRSSMQPDEVGSPLVQKILLCQRSLYGLDNT